MGPLVRKHLHVYVQLSTVRAGAPHTAAHKGTRSTAALDPSKVASDPVQKGATPAMLRPDLMYKDRVYDEKAWKRHSSTLRFLPQPKMMCAPARNTAQMHVSMCSRSVLFCPHNYLGKCGSDPGLCKVHFA